MCGDGRNEPGEICDDGDLIGSIGCLADCSGAAPGYTCTGGSSTTPRVCTELCGDGIRTSTESCDDGNVFLLDGCLSTCIVESG
ncbi:MAG: DUF4215 domain-containing protein [Streptococcus sp.]|nr:DUF4215 domain-containing protein [Streptococcus sp.]